MKSWVLAEFYPNGLFMFFSIRQKFFLHGRTENRVLTNYENDNEESFTVFWVFFFWKCEKTISDLLSEKHRFMLLFIFFGS